MARRENGRVGLRDPREVAGQAQIEDDGFASGNHAAHAIYRWEPGFESAIFSPVMRVLLSLVMMLALITYPKRGALL